MSRAGFRQSDSVTARREPRPPRAQRLSWALRLGAILQLFVVGTATYAGTAVPSSTPTATPTPITLAGGASGFNGVTGDCNENALVSIDELVRGVNIALERQPLGNCRAFDANGDGRVSVAELVSAVGIALRGAPPTFTPSAPPTLTPTQIPSGDLVTLLGSSPAQGESGVAVTRETVLRFDGPVDLSTVTEASIVPTYGGGGLFARLHVSPDARTVTLFYEVFLPSSSRIRVTIDGGLLRGANGVAVDADGDGQPGGVTSIDFDTLNLTTLPGTAVCGRVFASHLVSGANGMSMNVPLAGVTIEVDGAAGELNTVTDQFGNFRLEPAPVGRFFVFIRGTTATVGVPPGAYYPDVGKAWQATAGVETTIGDIFLPLIEAGTLQPVSATSETVIRFPESVRQEFPELADVQLTVPADSLFDDRLGTRGGMVGIAPVAPDRIPSRLPPGLDFPLVITVQTDGGENFDRPVPVCFPNLPDRTTGQPLAPGAESALWSFNHDTGEFEIVGPMRVTADGRLVCTEPGVGIIAPGWHGSAPGAGGSGGPLNGPGDEDGDEKGGDSPPPGAPTKAKCKKSSSDGDDVVDPVYLFSGEFYEEVEDLRIKGRGLDFIWSRKYRSQIGPNTVQGNGWDFSYNISLIPDGADLVVCDGNSRRDSYGLVALSSTQGQAAGTSVALLTGRTWSSPEFFQDLTLNADGTLTLTFPDGGTWLFNPLDGSPARGKIRANTDRNGNSLTFAYDAVGRLALITDTLDRDVSVAYNADGFIESVTDFAGRQVRYSYYQDGDANGARGDLESVRSPVISGTPNGNDFPNGKLTTYTYSTGFADDRLNHNLLTITDGRRNDPGDPTFGDGPYLRNVYAATTDADDLDFDRIVRQVWGDPDDVIDLVYVPQAPSAANANAYIKTIVNDRVGNVKEYFFERGNRVVIRREYTGRADPDKATTETTNRPLGKLRASDPDVFETRYAWNADALMTRIVRPNGNISEYVYESELNPDAPPRMRGNLRTIRHLPGPLAAVSDQSMIEEQFEYDDRFGCGLCGTAFVTRHVDGRGNETRFSYDERGNRLTATHRVPGVAETFTYNEFGQRTSHLLPDNGSGNRRRDAFDYYTSGPQRGYLQHIIFDADNLALTFTYEHDTAGNVIRRTDARGHDTLYTVNQLDQIVRETSREVTDGSGIRYQRDRFYDANNNLRRTDVLNLDDSGQAQANTHFSTTFEYETLNHIVRKTEEVDPTRNVVTEYAYDANRNRTLTRLGEATSGRQPANNVRVLYDERDRRFQVIAAEGAAEQSTTQYDYDGNENLVVERRGLEDTPRLFTAAYDGYDRLIRRTDPMGNATRVVYDANGNRSRVTVEGEIVDVVGSNANVRLSDASFTYDAIDRPISEERRFFDSESQADVGDGRIVKQAVYSPSSQIVRVIDDNGHERRYAYDSANRVREVTDAKGNITRFAYDEDSNVSIITAIELPDGGGPAETFSTTYEYDNLNRRIAATDNGANTQRIAYDSRHNTVRVTDKRGNVTRLVHDGLNRPTEVTRVLTDSGDGSGAPVLDVTITQTWDDSSRLTTRTDDNGHTTTYVYDPRNRKIVMRLADGTEQVWSYDVHGNPTTLTDANGNTVTQDYDLLDRLVERTVARGPSVSGTTFERFGYDGRSRVVAAEDDDSSLTRAYDSESNLVRETLNGETTSSVFDGERNQLRCTYPGGREITQTYDELDRMVETADAAGSLATYAFTGPWRVQRRDYQRVRTTFTYDTLRRVTATRHVADPTGAAVIVDERSYDWDAEFNKTERSNERTDLSQSFEYDSLDRLIASTVRAGTAAPETLRYDLDGVDNRESVTGDRAGAYALSPTAPDPADAQVNQYTSTAFDARTYDANGNLTAISPSVGSTPNVELTYDYRNQLVAHRNLPAGITTTYAYDALGRRIEKSVGGVSPVTTRFFYDRWRVVEEQSATGTPQATYAYGRYVDEVLNMRRAGADFFYHADDLFNVTAVTDANGNVVERYDYRDYGEPLITNAAGASRTTSAIGNPYMFAGRAYDAESGLYYFRTRYLDPLAGRFTARDPIGIWTDASNRGNAFGYVGSNPWTTLDPMGWSGEVLAAIEALVGGGTGTGAGAGAGATTTTTVGSGAQAFANFTPDRVANFVRNPGTQAVVRQAPNAVRGVCNLGRGGGRAAPYIIGLALVGLAGYDHFFNESQGMEAIYNLGDELINGPDPWDEPTLPDVPVPRGPGDTEPDFPELPDDPSPWDDDTKEDALGCAEAPGDDSTEEGDPINDTEEDTPTDQPQEGDPLDPTAEGDPEGESTEDEQCPVDVGSTEPPSLPPSLPQNVPPIPIPPSGPTFGGGAGNQP